MEQLPVAHAAPDLPAVHVQASSDTEMVDLWLGAYRSAATRRGYAIDMRAFAAFIAPAGLRQVTIRDVERFGDTLAGFAPATAARRLSAVKSLISLAHRVGYLPFDVGAPIQLPVVKDRLAERIISEWDVQQLFGRELDPRNNVLLRLVYSAGLRISEVADLHWRDFAPRDEAGQVTVLGKGGKTRAVLLPPVMWQRVIALRGDRGQDDPVFPSRTGGCVKARQIDRIVKAAARRAGLSPAISCHFLRHAHVSHALDRGAPVHVVRATVGHASLETTTRYSHARPGDSSARYLAD